MSITGRITGNSETEPLNAMGLCASFFFFYGSDFVEAAVVVAEVGGVQEDLDHFDGGFAGDDAAAEGENVGVVVFAGEARGVYIVGERGADAGHFVGSDGNANARAANGDAQIGLF